MRPSSAHTTLLSLAALAGHAAAGPIPNLRWPLDTAADCVEWYDNILGESCVYVRDFFTITPEQFHAWNPSLGLDCSGWQDATSYCIVTLGRLQDTYKSKSITFVPTTATVTGYSTTYYTTTYTPTPTLWRGTGCYALAGGDSYYRATVVGKLTPAKCHAECGLPDYRVAAVQAGDQCWCARGWGGERKDPGACNVPCEGDPGATCGGADAVEVFWKETFPPLPSSISRIWVTTTGSGGGAVATLPPGGAAVATTASSGAARKGVLFGMLG